jgi:hypothetical protein
MNRKVYYKVIKKLLLENYKNNYTTIGNNKITFLNNIESQSKTKVNDLINKDILIIIGSELFYKKVIESLNFLNEKIPNLFIFVKDRISVIKEKSRTGTHATLKNPILDLSMKSLSSTLFWSASLIAHEAMHVELHRLGKKTVGKEAESVCNIFQREVLKNIGASKKHIEYISKFIDEDKSKEHWDLDGDGDYDQDDHNLRDW